MGSNWSYTVTHYSKASSWASQSLTAAIEIIPMVTDISGGEVNTGIIEITANLGHYIREERSSESGFPTKIEHNDRIRITLDDGEGGTNYNQVFEVITKTPIKTASGGTKLRLQMQGIERHLQKIHFLKRIFNITPKDAIIELVSFYETNRTTDMPSLTLGTNNLPDQGVFTYDWGVSEDTIYNRINELVDTMGDSGGAGGVLDFFDFRFTYAADNVTSVTLDVFSSGSPTSGSEVTIDANSVNTGDNVAGIEEAEGTQLGAWGDNEAGSLPVDYSRFASRQLLLPSDGNSNYPQHTAGTYPAGAIVQKDGITYTTATETAATPSASPWTVLTTNLHYGELIQYSPWTKGKVNLWKNSGADPTDSSTFGAAMVDGNLIINDDESFRTWVDLETSGGTPSNIWTYGGATTGYYDGFRVLVNGVGTGPFAGTDSNGVEFDYNIAEWSAEDQDWKVKYDAFNAYGKDGDLDSMQVMIFQTGEIKVWNNPTTGAWNDITALDNGADCIHNYDSMSQTTSVHVNTNSVTVPKAEYATINNGSGIKAVYSWNPVATWYGLLFQDRTFAEYYRSGAWLTLRFPFPKNTHNSITEDVGELYGGGGQTWVTSTSYVQRDIVNNSSSYYICVVDHTSGTFSTDLTARKWKLLDGKEPTSIDTQNMTYTHNGARGFNFGLSSQDYGPLSSIDFFMKLIYSDATNGTIALEANFKMRCWMWDKNDNVVSQDFVIQHNDNYESVKLPLNGFEIYRGRRPRYEGSIISLNDIVPPNNLASVNQFEFRHIVGISWGTVDSYDEFGRYQAGINSFGSENPLALPHRTMEIWLDGLRFTKPLLYTTDIVTGTALVKQPEFLQQSSVFVYDQLENITKSELQKLQFKKSEYDLETELRTNINYGDFFYFTDNEIVEETDGVDNQVKLVNKGTEYSITKGVDGRGGGLRRIRGSRRFE